MLGSATRGQSRAPMIAGREEALSAIFETAATAPSRRKRLLRINAFVGSPYTYVFFAKRRESYNPIHKHAIPSDLWV